MERFQEVALVELQRLGVIGPPHGLGEVERVARDGVTSERDAPSAATCQHVVTQLTADRPEELAQGIAGALLVRLGPERGQQAVAGV